jgi:hypothetical protein
MMSNFDPDKHRFGMCYEERQGVYVYPVKTYMMNGSADEFLECVVISPYGKYCTRDYKINRITRFPDMDMFTRSAVEGLVKALDVISKGDCFAGSDLKAVAQQALTQFNEAYGEM